MQDPQNEGSRRTGAEGIADRLHSAAIHLLRRLRQEDAAAGLTAPRLSALSVIVFAGPLTLGELAEAEQVRPPTISRLVQGLEAEGLVERSRDPVDPRAGHGDARRRTRRHSLDWRHDRAVGPGRWRQLAQ